MKTLLLSITTLMCAGALAAEKTCEEVIADLNREATAEARERFKDLEGSCEGIVERDGELYMTTRMVVRRRSGNTVTLYLPATDRTFQVVADPSSRLLIGGRKVRPSSLQRGQELSIYVAVNEFTQPIIDEVALPTESEEIIVAPAVLVPVLPTTG